MELGLVQAGGHREGGRRAVRGNRLGHKAQGQVQCAEKAVVTHIWHQRAKPAAKDIKPISKSVPTRSSVSKGAKPDQTDGGNSSGPKKGPSGEEIIVGVK